MFGRDSAVKPWEEMGQLLSYLMTTVFVEQPTLLYVVWRSRVAFFEWGIPKKPTSNNNPIPKVWAGMRWQSHFWKSFSLFIIFKSGIAAAGEPIPLE